MEQIPINEKYSLTIQEASEYFSIGVKKMRRLAEENVGRFSVFSGNRYLILVSIKNDLYFLYVRRYDMRAHCCGWARFLFACTVRNSLYLPNSS